MSGTALGAYIILLDTHNDEKKRRSLSYSVDQKADKVIR